jgi:hypothetical protein
MRGTIVLAVALALCVASGAEAKSKPAPKAAKADKKKQPDYYPLPTGATWRYEFTANTGKGGFSNKVLSHKKEGATEVIDVELTAQNGSKTHQIYSKPPGWVLVHRQEFGAGAPPMVFTPARQMLKNPLTAGETWKWSGTGMGGVQIEETNTVEGAEEITVPAGKFGTVRVKTQIVQGGQPVTKTWWFAAGIGMVKSVSDTGSVQSTTELVESSLVRKK